MIRYSTDLRSMDPHFDEIIYIVYVCIEELRVLVYEARSGCNILVAKMTKLLTGRKFELKHMRSRNTMRYSTNVITKHILIEVKTFSSCLSASKE